MTAKEMRNLEDAHAWLKDQYTADGRVEVYLPDGLLHHFLEAMYGLELFTNIAADPILVTCKANGWIRDDLSRGVKAYVILPAILKPWKADEPKSAEEGTASPFDGFGPQTRELLNHLWDKGQKPARSISTVMQKLGYIPVSSKTKRDTFRGLVYRASENLEAMKNEPRYTIEKNKHDNTIRLIELPSRIVKKT
jgi:hypothetical protein